MNLLFSLVFLLFYCIHTYEYSVWMHDSVGASGVLLVRWCFFKHHSLCAFNLEVCFLFLVRALWISTAFSSLSVSIRWLQIVALSYSPNANKKFHSWPFPVNCWLLLFLLCVCVCVCYVCRFFFSSRIKIMFKESRKLRRFYSTGMDSLWRWKHYSLFHTRNYFVIVSNTYIYLVYSGSWKCRDSETCIAAYWYVEHNNRAIFKLCL